MKLRKSNVRLVALSCFYLLYIVIGASIFSAIEGPKERQQVKALKSLRKRFLTKHSCLTGKLCYISTITHSRFDNRFKVGIKCRIFETWNLYHRAFRVFVQQGARDQNWITIFFLLVKFYWWTFVNTDLGTTITILLTIIMMVAILVIIMVVIIIILIIPPVRHRIPTEMKKLN